MFEQFCPQFSTYMWVTNFVTEKTKTVFSLFIVASIHSQLQFGFLTLSKQKNAVHVNFYYHHFTNQVYENKQRKERVFKFWCFSVMHIKHLGVECLRKKQNYKSIEIGISQAKFGLATVREEILGCSQAMQFHKCL